LLPSQYRQPHLHCAPSERALRRSALNGFVPPRHKNALLLLLRTNGSVDASSRLVFLSEHIAAGPGLRVSVSQSAQNIVSLVEIKKLIMDSSFSATIEMCAQEKGVN
jgi:hypothetical protein